MTSSAAPCGAHPAGPLQRLAAAEDPALDGAPPRTAAAWLQAGAVLGLEGLVPALVGAGLLAEEGGVLPLAIARMMAAEAEQDPLWRATREVLAALQSAAIAAVPLKGPLLAARLYPPPLVRRSSDVDVLVAADDLPRALAVLRQLGYASPDAAHRAAEMRHHHHLLLTAAGKAAVELHFDALHGFGTILPGAALLQRACPAHIQRAGASWQGLLLQPTDELLYLAAHAAAHNFERPLWTLDVALLAGHPAIDWTVLWQRARRWHLLHAVVYALRTAARQLAGCDWVVHLPPATRWELGLHRARTRLRPMTRKSLRRFALDRACLLATCDDPWRAAWLAQYTGLRALGTAAQRIGWPPPQGWPPLPPRPPRWLQ